MIEFEGALVPADPAWVSKPLRVPASRVLSANDRADRRAQSGKVAAIRRDAQLLARASGLQRFDRAEVKIIVRFPDEKRRRDPNNYHATTKPLMDGLVDAGMFPDDSKDFILGPDIRASRFHAKPSLLEPMFDFITLVYPF